MDYIEAERDFFVQFIVGGEDSFEEYVARKRLDGTWGDDVELQAISEIYDRPVEIFAYRAEPMRTFHEEDNSQQ
jgi:OTU domain-containing protein 5